MSEKYNDHLKTILTADTRLVDEQGDLMLNKLKDLVNNLDENLLDILLADDESRDKFFIKVKEIYVFKQRDFIFFLEQNSLDNSFTSYANRIGLTLNGKFLKDNTDVVLDFPYKDCVLEGGQSTEEGTDVYFKYDDKEEEYVEEKSKRKEIFYNNIIAKDEIDRLFEPKAFEKILRFDKEGEAVPNEFARDENGNITDNLVIKGNNLLALHSLQKEFNGRVKLIYIDPPYNTGGDSFAYNDKFNHSSWLTFIYNRLTAAKKLLHNDGVIFIHIDYIEQAYLKVLADDIFGKNSALPPITIKTSTPAGFKVVNPGLVNVAEHILIYAIGDKKKALKKAYIKSNYQKDYNKVITNLHASPDQWEIKNIRDLALNKLGVKNTKELEKKFSKNISKLILEEAISQYALENADAVFATYGPHNPSTRLKDAIILSKKESTKIITIPNDNGGMHHLINGRLLAFYSNKLQLVNGELVPTQRLTDFWDDLSWDSISNEGGVTLKNGKKPESLLARLIEIVTDENDIVLDYHLGSGTTAAVAHKMGRQYIGIEQLNYGENDSVVRLQNVIEGEESGISKTVNWKGGGSFVYLELATNNQAAVELIQSAENFEELQNLFTELYEKYFLHYNVKIQEFKNKIIKEENFLQLPLERQKEMFVRMLDNNQLYVNVDDMEDTRYGLNPEDIRLTKDFYQINE